MNSHLQLKNRIKELRTEKGYSQTKLAELAGTTQNTISSLETGQYSPTAYLSGLICMALGCKWEECFYYELSVEGQKVPEAKKTVRKKLKKENKLGIAGV